MGVLGTDIDAVAQRFLLPLMEAGFTQTEAANLTDADESLTFVNANITPFKSRLIAGEQIGATCQVQPCVRSHGEFPFLFYFGMLGTITDGAFLDLVCEEVPKALLAAMPWTEPRNFTIAVDERDTDLIAGTRGFVDAGATLHVLGADDELETRWTYGAGDLLTGRGLTILHADRDRCGPDCRPRCSCGRWVELGNIIVVQSPDKTYIETGFGLESVQATAVGGSLYQLPAVASLVQKAEDLGLPEDLAAEAANLCRVLDALSAAGARPTARGAGHVTRKFALRLLDIAGKAEGDPGASSRLASLTTAPTLELLAQEEDRRRRGRQARLSAAKAYLGRVTPDDSTPAALRETYGLTQGEIAAVLAAAAG